MKEEIVYKIVFSESSEPDALLVSYWALYQARCKYGIGIVTKPPKYLAKHGYTLCAFATIEDARRFGGYKDVDYKLTDLDAKLYRAKATGVRTELLPRALFDDAFSHGTVHVQNKGLAGNWPTGTVMCDTIELVEEIEWK